MSYKAAVFDLDGTLLNTIVDLAWATNYALEQFNMPSYTVDEVRQMVGNGVAKLIRDAVPKGTDDETYQRVLACFKEHYADHSLDNTAPYPGILDAHLLELRKILIVLEVTTESKKDLVVKAKHIVAVIGMNRAKRKLKIVTNRDFIAIFFANTRHITS